MDARDLGVTTGAEAARVVRALGAHRYVAGKLHFVHAFVFDALLGEVPALAEASRWATDVLANPDIDASSRDERLFRSATEPEIAAALGAFWTPGASSDRAQDRLMARLEAAELEVGTHEPFDERCEEDVHPILIDAGWELLPLASLDPERHRGVIGAFGEPIDFEVACFEDESAIPPPSYLEELPAMGAVELLCGVDGDGVLREPLVLWTLGRDVYHDYVVRGVLRAARIG